MLQFNLMTIATVLPSDGLSAGNASCLTGTNTDAMMPQHSAAAAAHPQQHASRGPSYSMTDVESFGTRIVPSVHCVPGAPGPRAPPFVAVPLHWLSRYGYVAGYLCERRTAGYNSTLSPDSSLPFSSFNRFPSSQFPTSVTHGLSTGN